MSVSFDVITSFKTARIGVLNTYYGKVNSPFFMPVGTAGAIKAINIEEVEKIGFQMILSNTYHLMLRPGTEIISSIGGLNKFIGWNGPILTDSGGFQVMSLGNNAIRDNNGVEFTSHIDGSKHRLDPAKSVKIQKAIGSTITMAFDECTKFPISYLDALESMKISMEWAKLSKDNFDNATGFGIFGIVQGSVYEDLRLKSISQLKDIKFDGYAVGGLAVGESQKIMFEVLDYLLPHLPYDKPRYLMGVGYPLDIIGAVKRGIDMFDCVIPTRSGRTGQAFTKYGAINIKNSRFAKDPLPIDSSCSCKVCNTYSRAYISHLFKLKEINAAMLLTQHNLYFYSNLMKEIRYSIENQFLDKYEESFKENYCLGIK